MILWLVRHGATAWSETGQHTGRTDVPLLPQGEAQARALAVPLSEVTETGGFQRVFVSPLSRARRTAELAGLGAHLEVREELLEIDYGADEGLTRSQIQAKDPAWSFFVHGPHGGETLDEAAARARAILDIADECARRDGRPLVFVSHGHFLRILTAVHLGEAPAWGGHLALGTAAVSVLGREHGRAAILRWNDRHHVAGGA